MPDTPTQSEPSQIEQFLGIGPEQSEDAAAPESEVPADPQQADQPEPTPEPAAKTETDKPAEEQPQDTEEPAEPTKPQEPFDLPKAESELLKRFEALFPISEEDTLTLRSEPEKVLPKMAAAATYASIRQTIAYLSTNLPHMMEEVLRTREARTTAEDMFWSSNPNLDRAKHRDSLVRFGQAYRTANPTASVDQFIKDVGLMVAAANGALPKPAADPAPPPPPAPISGAVQRTAATPKKPAKAVNPQIEQFLASIG